MRGIQIAAFMFLMTKLFLEIDGNVGIFAIVVGLTIFGFKTIIKQAEDDEKRNQK